MKRFPLRIKLFSFVALLISSCCEIPAESQLQPATERVRQELMQKHGATIKRTQTDFPKALQGGPGFSRETAWKILIKERAAVSFEYLVLGRLSMGEHRMQSLVEDGGRYYDMHLIEVEHGGEHYQVEQWFDITPYFKSH